jgi:hypothetical protein
MGKRRNGYKILVGKPEVKVKAKWEDNNKMGLMEIGWGGMDWIHLVQCKDLW